MIERSQRHPPGTFSRCPTCQREPTHVTAWGGRTGDPVFSGKVGERHQLSCSCRRSTALQPTLADAVREWGERMGQQALPIPRPRRKYVRRAA